MGIQALMYEGPSQWSLCNSSLGGGTPGFAVVQPSPFLTLLEAVALPLDCCAVPALCPPVRDNCTE